MSMLPTILGMAMTFGAIMDDMEERGKERCDKLVEEYKNLKNLPRKKKKREKKRILLEYSIFSYDVLNHKRYDWAN